MVGIVPCGVSRASPPCFWSGWAAGQTATRPGRAGRAGADRGPGGCRRNDRTGRRRTGQLALSPGGYAAATGHYKRVILLRNTSGGACTLTGYPGVQFVDAWGNPLPTKAARGGLFTFPAVPPYQVKLAAGQIASFALGGLDFDAHADRSCPAAAEIDVIPPNDYQQITVRVSVPACAGGAVDVSPVVSGIDGPRFR